MAGCAQSGASGEISARSGASSVFTRLLSVLLNRFEDRQSDATRRPRQHMNARRVHPFPQRFEPIDIRDFLANSYLKGLLVRAITMQTLAF
jgi:hypothetical protein